MDLLKFRAGLILALIPVRLFALDPSIAIEQYQLRSWTSQRGYSTGDTLSLAQTPDGFLWLGTNTGLQRFDGVNVMPLNWHGTRVLDGTRIQALRVSRDGALWIGTPVGVNQFIHGELKSYTVADGLPRGGVVGLLEDRHGVIWVATAGADGSGLGAIGQSSIRSYGPGDGLPSSDIKALFEDRNGRLWVGTAAGICSWAPSDKQLCSVSSAEITTIAEDATGALVAGDLSGRAVITLRINGGRFENPGKRFLGVVPHAMLLDRDGNLWIGTLGQGLLRLRNGKIERLTERDGLSSNLVNALLEDRDGNLWVGTSRGINRLRNRVVSEVSLPVGRSPTVVLAGRDGSEWVGTVNFGLLSIIANHISAVPIKGIPKRTVISLYEYAGGLWVGTTGGLVCSRSGLVTAILNQDGSPLDRVFAMTDDHRGTLWLADARQGVLRLTNGRIDSSLHTRLPNGQVRSIYAAHDGALWVGFYDGRLEVIRPSQELVDAAASGWHASTVYAITEDKRGSIWVGSRQGLGRFRNGRWTFWDSSHGIPPGGLSSLLADESGIWAITADGLLHVPSEPLQSTKDGAPETLPLTLYGPDDGIRVKDTPQAANPGMARTKDGRFMIPAEEGVVMFDPDTLGRSARKTLVLIEQFLVDGQPVAIGPDKPGVRGRQFEFYYAAPNITAGEATHVYYRLDGIDREWIESRGDHRSSYGLLRPGDYRFRVTVGAGDEATLAFRIQPRFYETWYFSGAVVGAVALTVWGLYQLRINKIRYQLRLVFQERLRITRELHDSLLQGFTGVVYQLDAAAREFDRAPTVSKNRLQKALGQADSAMREARYAISLMRLPALENQTLSDAMVETGKQLVEGLDERFCYDIDPNANNLPYPVQANLYVITRELINNAVTHANASRIDLTVTCSGSSFRLTVEDDGVGFDPDTADRDTGHIGLGAIRERASLIGAAVTISSALGRGTRFELASKIADHAPWTH